MNILDEIAPKEPQLVMNLAREAGINVEDWGNFKGGQSKAASNPKYCYEWSFVDMQNGVVVLNLWHENMKELNGVVTYELNPRKHSERLNRGTVKNRALRMDTSIAYAAKSNLPVRIIVCDGHQSLNSDSDARPRRASKRALDAVSWTIKLYDQNTGKTILTRGEKNAHKYHDQFDTLEMPTTASKSRVEVTVHHRSPQVRRDVLDRAQGKCEWCGQVGFVMADDSIFLETHHIIPLAEDGPDTQSNVVALCPNHHREAHHGKRATIIRLALLDRFHDKD